MGVSIPVGIAAEPSALALALAFDSSACLLASASCSSLSFSFSASRRATSASTALDIYAGLNYFNLFRSITKSCSDAPVHRDLPVSYPSQIRIRRYSWNSLQRLGSRLSHSARPCRQVKRMSGTRRMTVARSYSQAIVRSQRLGLGPRTVARTLAVRVRP